MARGSDQAKQAATNSLQQSGNLASNASGIYSTLIPQLQSEAVAPPGFSPTTVAGMKTAAEQGAGGATSGAVGRGALLAGRTRNAGTAAKAISDAARTGGQQLSESDLAIDNENAALKAKQQQEALGQLQGIYGTDVTGSNQAIGEVGSNVNADVNAQNASYNWLKPIEAVSGLLNAGAKFVPCWVAEAIYGVEDPRTHTVRAWINGPFRQTYVGGFVRGLYIVIGQPLAWGVRRSPWLRAALRPLFDAALRRATNA